jgi:hypothetical protein
VPAGRRCTWLDVSVLLVAAMALALVGVSGASAQAAVHRQTDPVRWFSDGSVVQGAWSTLTTSDTGAQFTLTTNGLAPGHEVTVWWVVFNHPENCTHGVLGLRCGEGDLSVPGVEASVLYGAGHVIGGSGMASYGASLGVGDTSGALFGPGLLDPLSADIHLVVHDHGILSADQIATGIHNFGPCADPVPDCEDVQFSAHEQ